MKEAEELIKIFLKNMNETKSLSSKINNSTLFGYHDFLNLWKKDEEKILYHHKTFQQMYTTNDGKRKPHQKVIQSLIDYINEKSITSIQKKELINFTYAFFYKNKVNTISFKLYYSLRNKKIDEFLSSVNQPSESNNLKENNLPAETGSIRNLNRTSKKVKNLWEFHKNQIKQ